MDGTSDKKQFTFDHKTKNSVRSVNRTHAVFVFNTPAFAFFLYREYNIHTMPPDNNYGTDGSPDSFFVKHYILLGVVAAIFLLIIPAFWIYNEIKPTVEPSSVQDGPQQTEELRVFTEEEKLQILEGLSVSDAENTSEKEKFKILDTLSKQSSPTTLSEAEKLKILNSLSQ